MWRTSIRWLLVRSCISPCSCSLGIPAPPSAWAAALRSSTDTPDSFTPSKRGTSHRNMSLREQGMSTSCMVGRDVQDQVLSRFFVSIHAEGTKC